MNKITYYLGAGASRNSVPIWKEQSEAMMNLAEDYLDDETFKIQKRNNPKTDDASKMLWDIGYFGYKGFKFGTVDTYAKKLVLNNSNEELWKLKLAVSNFFTIWQYSNNFPKKNKIYTDQIDRRYISLLASILKEGDVNPKIKENINFISWNYDLQLESAYKEFCDNKDWKEITKYLKFQSSIKNHDLIICHLNGYHGFYKSIEGKKEINYLDRVNKIGDYKEIINELKFTYESQNKGSIDYTSHINYAWENKENDIAENARNQANNVIKNSDITVIIGYSFPSFNRSVDKEILGQIKESSTVFYQDPNASTSFLERMIPNWKDKNIKLEIENKNMEYFILPDDF